MSIIFFVHNINFFFTKSSHIDVRKGFFNFCVKKMKNWILKLFMVRIHYIFLIFKKILKFLGLTNCIKHWVESAYLIKLLKKLNRKGTFVHTNSKFVSALLHSILHLQFKDHAYVSISNV